MQFDRAVPERFPPPARLTRAQARRHAEVLRRALRHHDHRCYVLDRPRISDAAYDRLLARLLAVERAFLRLIGRRR